MKRIYFSILVLFVISFGLIYSQTLNKEEVFKKLLDKYGKMKSVSFKFTSPDGKNLGGSLIAERGNKYVIDTRDRDVYCNGETIWNHSISDNDVLISVFDKSNISPMSLESFFFNFLELYVPTELSESTSSLGTKSFIIQLSPKGEKSYDIDDVKIWIEPKNYVIKSVKLKIAGKIQTLNIEDLVLDKNYPDKTFEYVSTGKEHIIDFR
ncbi:MAG: hypothetical protein EPN82_10040 [Bacteroidetes bacterium]|nr:MAG: hypothetical protein EPN82_10040 [Bacteroidota bacterium]